MSDSTEPAPPPAFEDPSPTVKVSVPTVPPPDRREETLRAAWAKSFAVQPWIEDPLDRTNFLLDVIDAQRVSRVGDMQWDEEDQDGPPSNID